MAVKASGTNHIVIHWPPWLDARRLASYATLRLPRAMLTDVVFLCCEPLRPDAHCNAVLHPQLAMRT
eukprot:5818422-Pyramimonas_sp.AAC.1